MPPRRSYQERAAKRRRTNPADETSSGPQASQRTPPVLPGPSGLGQLTPEMIAAINTAVTQALQAAAATPHVQFVPDSQVPVECSSVLPRIDSSTEVQPATEAAGAVHGTVQRMLDHVIGTQDNASTSREIQSPGTGYEPRANPSTGATATRELGDTLTQLLEASLSATSLSTYRRPWYLYRHFQADKLQIQGPIFPILSEHLALFIAYLAEKKYASSTVLTYISALGFPHRLAGFPDPTKEDMIQLTLRGYSKLNPARDSRLPISLPILEHIISSCVHTQATLYKRRLLQGMYAIAFFAALRIGEITCQPKQTNRNLIFINQASFMKRNGDSIDTIKLTLRHYKHSNPADPVNIFIYQAQPVCPVSLLLAYLNLRGTSPGPLFCWPDLSPISRNFFTQALADSLRFCDLDVSEYKSHSFRIGAASWAASKGMSDAQIRAFGRWRSNAFLRYIRAPSISSP
ncbi:PREDICTED: uncharacterized protein LOC107341260 [Acropora digitifera]|uniref:uncharacterized protein LOC107341260 n=1 Tax=Acropora digitifera TaxID=70779 RepID=UPI00077A82B7|nr:PREDICTED: uncharacterized protein LOC107341260 [Acropora digitifera]